MPIYKDTVPFKNIEIAVLENKLKIFNGTLGPAVRISDSKVSCRCYITCPTAIVGNQCGQLTQTCGVGKNTSGEDVVTKQLSLGGLVCTNMPMVLDYDFGFSSDEVTFFAVFSDGSTVNIGSTGCISETGTFVFVIPKGAVALKTVSVFACDGSGLNSSIDTFTISCA